MSASMPNAKHSNFLPVLLLYFGGLPLADVIAGGLSTFFGIDWFAVAYKGGALLILILVAMMGNLRKGYAVFAIIVITLLGLGAGVRETLGMGGFADDMVFIARGPILLSAILVTMLSLDRGDVERVARTYFVATWLAVILSIAVTDWLGISLETYDAGYGSKGFYAAANEVAFGFVLSWWYIQVRMCRSAWQSALLLSATCFLIYTLGTKAGFVVIPILGLWYVGRWLFLNRYINLAIFVLIAGLVSVAAGSIFLAVLPYLPASEASSFFIAKNGVDTTLTGGRFIDLDQIVRIIQSYSIAEFIFGAGFQNFWFAIDGNSVESDLIDTLGGGGIIFAGWFYGTLLWGYSLSKVKAPSGKTLDTAWAYVFIAAIMHSIFVGHIAFAASPLASLAMFLALAYKERVNEDSPRSVLV
jgi:hypothetical protein